MNKYVEIIKLIEKIFGKDAVSKSLGTRTNVVRFPKGKQGLDPTKSAFDVQGTSQTKPHLVETIKNSIEDRIGDLSQMNDSELLMYKGNLQRLNNHLNPPSAEVIEAGSKQRVTGEGLEKLKEEQGLVAPPTTPLGSAQFNLKRAEQEMKNISKEFDLGELIKGAGRDQLSEMKLHNEGLVRAVTRQILSEDIKAGKIKGLTLDDLGTSREPIDYFRKIYGEGALEQLDSLTPEFNRLATEQEAAKLARSKFKIEPKETPVDESKTYEQLEEMIKKGEPEEKADGGSIGLDYLMGFDNRPKYKSGGDVKKILDIIAKVNKELKGKKSMESMGSKEPIKLVEEPRTLGGLPIAEESANIGDKLDELSKAGVDTFEKKKEYLDLRLKFIDSLDPRKQNKALDFQRKSIDTEQRLLLKAEEKGLDFDTFEKLRTGLYDARKQKTLNFIKTGKVDVEPVKAPTTFEEVQKRYKTAAKAADEIFPNYDTPKTAASELADVMAEQKYGKSLDDLSGDIKQELYEEAYNYITSVNRLPKMSPKNVPPEVLENKMNEVLNQYDKSIFIKNEEGMVDVTNPENIEKMALLLKRDHPEIYNQLFNLTEDLNQKQQLLDFDVTGRKPNKDGGLNYLLGM